MTARSSIVVLALGALVVGATGAEPGGLADTRPLAGPVTAMPSVSDSALDELRVGRFWHAARIMRAEGADRGGPADVLALARAEAGWENWPAVLGLLEDAAWLDGIADGQGRYLLGRALEHAGRWREAVEAYGQYVALVGDSTPERTAALVGRARSAWSVGDRQTAFASLARLRGAPLARSWTAVELAFVSVEEGDPAAVAALLDHVIEPPARDLLWRADADARLAAGDTAGAERAFAALRETVGGSHRAEAAVELGRLRLAARDSGRARALLREGFDEARGAARSRAAAGLVDLGVEDLEQALELAAVLDRAGDGARALRAYDRAARLAAGGGGALPERSRLERARLMSTVRARQPEALEEFRAIRETTRSSTIGARNLEVWARMRDRQGMRPQVATLRRWLLEEYPESDEAAEVVWRDGSGAEARGDLDSALERYTFVAEHARTHARAGQARMRSGQIHLRLGRSEAAATVFEQYLEDFPTGRRWQEAAYWAGRTRIELGDTTAGTAHLRRVLTQPVEYYAVMSAELLGEDFAVNVPPGEKPLEPGWLTEGLARLDVLTEAGLERGAEAEISRLRTRTEGERGPRLRLAEALIERGRTIDGINLGWALLEEAGGWDQEILRVTYPFPYRELVRREAEEWGIDPFMMAAIIRQESAFKADIVSRAGAIGLMQVMPPTGAQLARTHGPDRFTEASLTAPEVNLHLGAAFFVEMSRRYDNDLPLVLSAYNAGPTRATRWRRYPEASDPLRFTERIPFTETRGYVKSVRRNLGLYRVLYGQQ